MMTPRENFIRFLKNEEYEWTPTNVDQLQFRPTLILDHVARGMVAQQNPYTGEYGGKDLFGIDWVFEPAVGGSMEVAPLFEDIEDWEDHVVFPDVDSLDWEGCAKENEEYLKTDKIVFSTIYTGFFERLISFVGFENSAMALIDEDQQEDVHKIFEKLTEVYIKLVQRLHRHFNVEIIEIHDDWGTQRDTMFSVATLKEMILPYMKKVIDAAHEEGMFVELHSCGKIDSFIPAVIEAGFDTWRGQAAVIDKKTLVENYGDKFKFGVEIRPAAPLSDEEAMELAKKTLADYQGKNVWVVLARTVSPAQRNAIYQYIRENGKI